MGNTTSNQATKGKGLGLRISRLVALAVLAAVMATAVAVALIQTSRDLSAKRANIEATGYVMAASVADAVLDRKPEAARAALRAVSRMKDILTATAITADGEALASIGQATYLASDIVEKDQNNLALLYRGHFPVSVEIVRGGRAVGRLVLLADVSDTRTTFITTLAVTLMSAVVMAVFGVMLSKPLQWRIVNPLVSLTQSISRIRATRDYSHDIAGTNATDELGVLVESFNGLMTDIRQRDQALQQLAFVDTLTGLGNRAHFQRNVDEWIGGKPADKQTGAVLLFSIHGFNGMNDAFGQSIGDAIVLSVAATIHQATGLSHDLARTGGSEFSLLLRSTSDCQRQAEDAIAVIQKAFETPLRILHFELQVNLDAGAVVLPANGLSNPDSNSLMRAARLAQNAARAKGAGRSAFFTPLMDEEVRRETELGQALRAAIDNGELVAFYQPQYDVKAGRIAGFEALARWNHPTKGFISPAHFIPVAEQTGLIAPLGEWMLNEACRQAKDWMSEGHAPRIMSVNASPMQLLDAEFVGRVRSALENANLPPSLLCIEVTESVFIGDSMTEVQAVLKQLADLGVKLALDDFGTGYSSLGSLAKLPFHKLKIDRSFVTEADKSKRKAELLKSVISMSHSLGMTVVAEGAETVQELALLTQLKADEVQGYVVSRPLPATEALAMTREVEARAKTAFAVAS